ncbi:TetR/AcrR family transcriptional regulator [Microbacterium aurantiacum]|uniref:TetR/AcrR family transcriptional regulator n=1 Tax=Microbacterium aurantiacum TaxID=162393 RepID=UPI0015E11BD6|nr:TetR/AcrR family transcriptional regulator [Microbacterium aurantiacum]
MPRPSRFTTDDVLDAALQSIAEKGRDVTISMIADHLGGPVGSIYHRFESRDEILVRLWLRCVRRFQAAFISAAEDNDDPFEALLACAVSIPRFCAEHPAEAVGLTLYRQERLLATLPSGALRDEVAGMNIDVMELMTTLARRQYPDARDAVERVDLAIRVIPYGIVRGLLGGPIPALIEPAVIAAAKAVLSADTTTTPPPHSGSASPAS